MSGDADVSILQASGTDGPASTAAHAASSVQPDELVGTEVGYRYSPSFADVLAGMNCSLLVSTYQAGQVVAVGVDQGQLSFAFRRFDQAMGVAVARDRIAVAGRDQVWLLDDHSELARAIEPLGRHDTCWLPRSSIVTGDIRCHEIVWGVDDRGEPDLWIVNTLFSCLAGLAARYSFVPRWRPRFVSELAAQDRCHLNGLAMRDGSPAFVTVMAPTDAPSGWRSGPNTDGAVLDVASHEAVTTGLAMPHSPRWHEGNLFVLHSGLGRLERVDLATGHREEVALVPGYARGLAFHQHLAFVGLSRIRESAIFGGAPIAAYHDRLKCGIGVIDVRTGTTVATLEFTSGVEEIFDVQVVPEARCPTFGSPSGEPGEVWLLPDQSGSAARDQRTPSRQA